MCIPPSTQNNVTMCAIQVYQPDDHGLIDDLRIHSQEHSTVHTITRIHSTAHTITEGWGGWDVAYASNKKQRRIEYAFTPYHIKSITARERMCAYHSGRSSFSV